MFVVVNILDIPLSRQVKKRLTGTPQISAANIFVTVCEIIVNFVANKGNFAKMIPVVLLTHNNKV